MADHGQNECPHTAAEDSPVVRLDRPNHFYHDVLGCPFECTDRHNHPIKE